MTTSGEITLANPERRSDADRRRNRGRTLVYSLYMKRRRHVRRETTTGDYYLDVIELRIMAAAIAIVVLSSADSLFTLALLQRGASEVNPMMDYLITIDSTLFIFSKLLITATGVLFLAAHSRFRVFRILRGQHALYAILFIYAALINYELTLLA